MTAQDCTIQVFMNAWFNGDRSVLSDDEFEQIHLEYVDISGMSKTQELELNSQLYYLQNRVERVKLLLFALRLSVQEIGKPFQVGIDDLKSYGHKLYWDGDAVVFAKMLSKIETKESRYIIQLQQKEDEVLAFYKAKTSGVATVKQSRQQFIKNIIELRKRGHYIKENETTVEVLALAIKTENDAAEDAGRKK